MALFHPRTVFLKRHRPRHEICHHQLKQKNNDVYSQLLLRVLVLLRNLIISFKMHVSIIDMAHKHPKQQVTISPSPSVYILSADDTFTEAPW